MADLLLVQIVFFTFCVMLRTLAAHLKVSESSKVGNIFESISVTVFRPRT